MATLSSSLPPLSDFLKRRRPETERHIIILAPVILCMVGFGLLVAAFVRGIHLSPTSLVFFATMTSFLYIYMYEHRHCYMVTLGTGHIVDRAPILYTLLYLAIAIAYIFIAVCLIVSGIYNQGQMW